MLHGRLVGSCTRWRKELAPCMTLKNSTSIAVDTTNYAYDWQDGTAPGPISFIDKLRQEARDGDIFYIVTGNWLLIVLQRAAAADVNMGDRSISIFQ